MDGTGAGRAEPTGTVTRNGPPGSAGTPARAVGPADATGPLPVTLPADATGPLPAEARPAGIADATGPQPVAIGDEASGTAGSGRYTADHGADHSADHTADHSAPAPVAPSAPTTGLPIIPASSDFGGLFDDGSAAAGPGEVPGGRHAAGAAGTGAGPSGGAGQHPPPGGPPPTAAMPSIFTPSVGPADATGPMPAMGLPPAEVPAAAPPVVSPPAVPAPAAPPHQAPAPLTENTGVTPALPLPAAPAGAATEPAPDTAAWSVPPASGTADAWSFANGERPSGGAQAWPLPAPGGGAHTGGGPPPDTGSAPATDSGGAPRRAAWPLTVVGVLVAIAAGIALVVSFARTDPGELISAATTDVTGWNGVHYRGTAAAIDGGEIQFDLTVVGDSATGTLSRDGGQATAELVRDSAGTLLKANHNWWLYHHPTRADDLADTWVSDPLTETQEIDPILELPPHALGLHVRPEEQPGQWEALEEQVVDGQNGVVLFDGTRRVIVTTTEPHGLLALDFGAAAERAPVRVTDIAADDADATEWAAAGIRAAESPKTLTQRLLERPLVAIQLQPEPLCVTPTCAVTVTVTNSGSVPARGHLEVAADGQIVANHPLDVQPGQVATFTANAPNPQFATEGATGQILWESRAVDD